MTRKQKPSSWRDWLTFPKAFTYDVDAPIEDVVLALGSLEKDREGLSAKSQDITVVPSGNKYQFHFRIQRWSRDTALANGVIRDDKTGTHIKGMSRMNQAAMIFYLISLLFFIPCSILFLTTAQFSIGLTLIIIIIATLANIYRSARDRQQVIDEIEKGLGHLTLNLHIQKQKRAADRTNQRLSADNESVWDEAVSEQSRQQERSKR